MTQLFFKNGLFVLSIWISITELRTSYFFWGVYSWKVFFFWKYCCREDFQPPWWIQFLQKHSYNSNHVNYRYSYRKWRKISTLDSRLLFTPFKQVYWYKLQCEFNNNSLSLKPFSMSQTSIKGATKWPYIIEMLLLANDKKNSMRKYRHFVIFLKPSYRGPSWGQFQVAWF